MVFSPLPATTVAILDLDGVLVDLHLDGPRVRREVNAILAGEGMSLDGQDLQAGIAAACAAAMNRDPEAGAHLAARLWAVVDQEEARHAPTCSIHPGAASLLESDVPIALFTGQHQACALAALAAVGIDPGRFFAIQARSGVASIKPGAVPVLALLSAPEAVGAERVFFVGHHPAYMGSAVAARQALAGRAPELIAIGYAHSMGEAPHLEAAGADFVVTTISEAAEMVAAPRSPHHLSMVLLAWNEEGSIVAAVRDCRRFGRLWLSGYEIIVIDDGSSDATASRAETASEGDVRVVRHARNLGMGAGMRAGYAAARCDYIAPLPADRQVRPQSLLAFLPQVSPQTTALSTYVTPPAGELRRLMSIVFRLIVRGLGGLQVDFAGSYVFHRHWLETIDLASVRSETFVFSFEFLERLRRAGSRFSQVTMRPFLREVGESREVALRRILRVFGEIVRYRARTFI